MNTEQSLPGSTNAGGRAKARSIFLDLTDSLYCVLTGREAVIVEANRAFAEAIGSDPTDIEKQSLVKLAHPDDRDAVTRALERCLAEKERVTGLAGRFRRADGSYAGLEWKMRQLGDGNLVSAAGKIVSGEKRRRGAFDFPGLLQEVVDKLPVGITIWGPDGRPLVINRWFSELTGYYPQYIEDFESWFRQAFSEKRLLREMLREGAKAEYANGYICRHKITCRDGSAKELECRVFRMDRGLLLVIVTDITLDKLAREQELKRQRFLEAVLYHAPDAIVTMDEKHRVVDWNPGAVKMFGYRPEEVIGRHLDHLVAGKDRFEEASRKTRMVLSGKRVEPFETVRYRKDGSAVRVIAGGSPIIIDGTLVGVVAIYTDITARVEAEKALQQSEARFRALVEKLPLGILLVSEDNRCLYANPFIEKKLGFVIDEYRDISSMMVKAAPDEKYRQKLKSMWEEDMRLAAEGRAKQREVKIFCPDGTWRYMQTLLVGMESGERFLVCEDITEKTKLEMQFQQAQRFEAIGTLAGGIAHDFNNLMAGIQGFASLLKMELDKNHPHWGHLQAIEDYVRSAADLTAKLLGLAKGGKYEVKPHDVNRLLADSAVIFSRTRKEVRCHQRLWPDALVVEADKSQIQQVFLNILVNAWQAMPEGGDIYLETSRVKFRKEESRVYNLPTGHYAKISIVDTGIGMDEEIRRRIFDPFFTTKAKGRGTGLGLASAYGIVKNHGGVISVYSEPGKGSSFHIYLPLTQKQPEVTERRAKEISKGSGTILLVDDEEMILTVGKLMLEKLGFGVITANSGREAVKIMKQEDKRIDLVILDLVMPDMDGGKVFDKIRALRPRVPVLLSSGYSIDGQSRAILRRGCNGFIQKPFTVSELSEKITICLQK